MADGVTQTILYDRVLNERGVYGNCLQAAIASLLGLHIDAVPHFAAFVWWEPAVELWARGRGLTLHTQTVSDGRFPERRAIVTGPSPRNRSEGHACIAEHGAITWDPHPSRAGLVHVQRWLWFQPWPDGDRTCWLCNRPGPGPISGDSGDTNE